MSDSKVKLNIDLNLNYYEDQLRAEIASDLTALKILLDSHSHPNYFNSPFILNQGFVFSQITVPPYAFFERREINKCFKSIMGSLQDYMDKLIATLKLQSKNLKIQLNLFTPTLLKNYLEELIKEDILDVATNTSLTIPKKLNILLENPEHQQIKESIQSYFNVRNGLEHH